MACALKGNGARRAPPHCFSYLLFDPPLVSPLPGFGKRSFWVVLGCFAAYAGVTNWPLTELRDAGRVLDVDMCSPSGLLFEPYGCTHSIASRGMLSGLALLHGSQIRDSSSRQKGVLDI